MRNRRVEADAVLPHMCDTSPLAHQAQSHACTHPFLRTAANFSPSNPCCLSSASTHRPPQGQDWIHTTAPLPWIHITPTTLIHANPPPNPPPPPLCQNWLYDEGEDEPKSVYVAKLEELQKQGDPIQLRASEDAARPVQVGGWPGGWVLVGWGGLVRVCV